MKTQVPFDTYPVNAALDPSGCFAMKLKYLQIVNDDSVFEEVVKEKPLPMSPELLEFGFRYILTTMADHISRDCRPHRMGKYLKASTSRQPPTCVAALRAFPLRQHLYAVNLEE